MRWCDKNDVGYVFGLQKNSVWEGKIALRNDASPDPEISLWRQAIVFPMVSLPDHQELGPAPLGGRQSGVQRQGSQPSFRCGQTFPAAKAFSMRRSTGRGSMASKSAGSKMPGRSAARRLSREVSIGRCTACEARWKNRIKEQQLCLFADRTSCTRFIANQFRLMLSSFGVRANRRHPTASFDGNQERPTAGRHDPSASVEDRRARSRDGSACGVSSLQSLSNGGNCLTTRWIVFAAATSRAHFGDIHHARGDVIDVGGKGALRAQRPKWVTNCPAGVARPKTLVNNGRMQYPG